MITYPNAKINIGLYVMDKGADGYHDIETVFCPVDLTDILEIIISGEKEDQFTMSGLPVPGDPAGNLCLKAVNLLRKDFSIPPLKIHLHKIIPTGSGLGGGSSDGAFTIKLANKLLDLGLSEVQMKMYAAQLGSDCTFFIDNKTSFGWGRGEKLEKISLDLSDYTFVIVVPGVHVSTAKAYEMIDSQRKDREQDILRNIHKGCHLINAVESGPPSWNQLVENEFESPVFSVYPAIAKIKDDLYKIGAVYASMSGSGSAVYGVFKGDFQPPDEPGSSIYTVRSL